MFNFSKLGVPIIQAPMAGGINNPLFASEVSNAGGVGSFGFAYSTPQKISEDLAATRALTNGPMNANFFVFSPVDLPAEAMGCTRFQRHFVKVVDETGDFKW